MILTRRTIQRTIACSGAVLALLVFACLDTVDHRPYFRAAYFQNTLGELEGRAATNHAVTGRLYAGFGKALLTPTLNAAEEMPREGKFRALPLAGYGNRHSRPAEGVHDDLFAKAVALRAGSRTGVMVAADALIIPREVADAAASGLRREFGLEREQIYFAATHSHSSIGGWGEGVVAEAFAGKFNPGARVWFAECLVRAAREALQDLKPAECASGNFNAPEFVRNRLIGKLGRVDPAFSFLAFRQEGGRVAVAGSYAAHATVLPGSQMKFSADYPGCWERAMETNGVAMALFLAGEVGSHGPKPPEPGFAGAEQMGNALAEETCAALRDAAFTNTVRFGMLGLEVELPPLNTRITDALRLRPWVSRLLLPPVRPSFLQVLRLGDCLWVSTPCDFSGELALPIKNLLRARGISAAITSFNGDYIGYVIPRRYYHLSGYEPRLMSFFGPNVPDYLEDLIRRMTLGMIQAPASPKNGIAAEPRTAALVLP